MKIHPAINDEQVDEIMEIARSKGLDIIDYDKFYNVYKIGCKFGNLYKKKEPRAAGKIMLIGLQKNVWIYIQSMSSWFKTSPIITCKKDKDSIIIETMNSLYQLEEQK